MLAGIGVMVLLLPINALLVTKARAIQVSAGVCSRRIYPFTVLVLASIPRIPIHLFTSLLLLRPCEPHMSLLSTS